MRLALLSEFKRRQSMPPSDESIKTQAAQGRTDGHMILMSSVYATGKCKVYLSFQTKYHEMISILYRTELEIYACDCDLMPSPHIA